MSGYIPSAKREDWRTPAEVVDLVRSLYGGTIDLDPCAPDDPDNWIAANNYPASVDGLSKPWRGSAYVNPPFGSLRTWIEKSSEEAALGCEVLLLMPARTDTRAWHRCVPTASAICFWRGRMRFAGAPASCPFPVALVYWGPQIQRFREVFGPHGMVIRP